MNKATLPASVRLETLIMYARGSLRESISQLLAPIAYRIDTFNGNQRVVSSSSLKNNEET
jgi:hypothetical protein